MIKRTFDITARIEQGQPPFCFQAVQNDKDVYVLRIRITEGDKEIDYTQVSSATITFALANGTVVQSDPERLAISSGGITYEMGTTEISCPGKVTASIQLFGEDGERLTTARFRFEVVADLITPGAVQSESRFPLLQQLVADVEQLKQDIVNLQIPDGSIMDVKLSDAAGQIKQRLASKNLLHNWDFRNPVNQRGQSSYSGAGYTVDGWTLNSQVLNLKEGYVELRRTLVTGAPTLSQYIENYGSYADETLTFSTEVKVTAGKTVTVLIMDGVNTYSQSYSPGASKWNIITVSGKINAAPSQLRCAIQIASASAAVGDAVWVRRAKLELGSVSTLANDPPADYGEQLALCQRYQLSLTSDLVPATVIGTNALFFLIPTPVQMRIMPSIAINNFQIKDMNGVEQAGFTITVSSVRSNGIMMRAEKTSHGLTNANISAGTLSLLDANL